MASTLSCSTSIFNFDLGASTHEQVPPDGLPPIAHQNATATGTYILGYLSE